MTDKKEIKQVEEQSTPEQTMEEYVKTLSGKELLEFLSTLHPSDAYIVMRDYVQTSTIKELKGDMELRGEFKELSTKANKSYERDNTLVKFGEVDKMVGSVYQGIMQNMKMIADTQLEVLQKVNRIEEYVGLPITEWKYFRREEIPQDQEMVQPTTEEGEVNED